MIIKHFSFSYAYEFVDRIVKTVYQLKGISVYHCPGISVYHFQINSNDFISRVSRPQKWTLLHVYIQNVNYSDYVWLTGHYVEESVSEIRDFLKRADIPIPLWLSNHGIQTHIYDLEIILDEACRKFTEATFILLFGDKEFLFQFQLLIAKHLHTIKKTAHPNLLGQDGILKRPRYLPTWLKSAVFHRDKGLCQICGRDLTGMIDVVNDLRLDHILPLAKSGSNDPNNFQLLCDKCNKKKSAKLFIGHFGFFSYW